MTDDDELRAIVSPGYAWIKVKRMPPASGVIARDYEALAEHHIQETEFLVAKCRELASEILAERDIVRRRVEERFAKHDD